MAAQFNNIPDAGTRWTSLADYARSIPGIAIPGSVSEEMRNPTHTRNLLCRIGKQNDGSPTLQLIGRQMGTYTQVHDSRPLPLTSQDVQIMFMLNLINKVSAHDVNDGAYEKYCLIRPDQPNACTIYVSSSVNCPVKAIGLHAPVAVAMDSMSSWLASTGWQRTNSGAGD